MKRLAITILAVMVLAAVLVSGCAKTAPSTTPATTPEPAAKTLDIGIVTPLTGPSAFLGSEMQHGIELAIDVQNEQGGVTVGGQKYILNPVIRDSKGDILVSKTIAEELVLDKGIKVIGGPFIGDAVGVQTVTEPNKVILFPLVPAVASLTGPNKPYTFFLSPPFELIYTNICAYLQKFYPEAKTIHGIGPDLADLPMFETAVQAVLPRYGQEWTGVEKFPASTRDFAPIIPRLLAAKPDVVDTMSTPGSMGAIYALLVKQLREAGYDGIIIAPGVPPPGVMEEVVPMQFRTRIVTVEVDPDSPMVTQAYRDVHYRAQKKYGEIPAPLIHQCYHVMKGFFEFLNTQSTMDTTAWMEGFATYHWQGIYGLDSYWMGKKRFGIDRFTWRGTWASEYKEGKLETNFAAPIPYDMFVGE